MDKSRNFLVDSELEWIDVAQGVRRQIVGYDQQLMVVKVKFKKGAVGDPHSHLHSQSSIVMNGVFELTINGVKKILRTGEGYYVEPNVVHSALCLEDGVIIDSFSPARLDFL